MRRSSGETIPPAYEKDLAPEALDNHPLTLSKTAEHYTPKELLQSVRDVMGAIDVDPASCADAQKQVKATVWFDERRNGLIQDWHGRAYINPPGDTKGKLPKLFWKKLVVEVRHERVSEFIWLAFNLAHVRTLQFDKDVLPECDVCVLEKRIKFTGDSPTKDNAFLYWGPNRDRFAEVFSQWGVTWRGRGRSAHKRTLRSQRSG
jgi:ParB family chromosome partitioning protein